VASDAAALDVPPQELEALIDVDHPRLVGRQAQTHRREHCGYLVPQRVGVVARAVDHDEEVIRVADQSHGRTACAAMLGACPFGTERFPFAGEVLVQDGQGDVRQQR
jgi:hypothetical protein